MRSFALNALAAVSGLSAVAAGSALTVINPCPDCPKSIYQSKITVTEQYQAVSTCVPVKTTKKKKVIETASCSSYDFVSTTIPCLGGASSTVVTKTDQLVKLNHVSTVLESYVYSPYPTSGPSWNGTAKYGNETSDGTSTSTVYQTLVVDTYAKYDECGPMALPPWEGSGLCKVCGDGVEKKNQPVYVSKWVDGVPTSYPETWVSTKPTPVSSTHETAYSTSAYASSSGVNTISCTATFTPSNSKGGYTAPVTSTFAITTSVAKPCSVDLTKYVTVTYTKEPAPSVSHYESAAAVSTATYLSSGVHTIPIVTTCTPKGNPEFTAPVTTTVYYTTTVTGAPHTVYCHTTVTVTFTSTSTYCPATVISGSTQYPSSTAPPTVSAYPTASSSGYPTTGYPTGYPTGSPSCEYYGCLGSSDGFSTFSVIESSGSNDIELCTSECKAAGYAFAGLYNTDCYCASSVGDASSEKANGVCDISCPGKSSEKCGGDSLVTRKRNYITKSILLDVYQCETPTPTSSSSSATSEPTSDPSSDPDPETYRRGIDSDMEISARKARDIKLRRGGLLQNPKVKQGPALAKRDFGLKQPFGQ